MENNEIEYNVDKMRKFTKHDALLRFVVNDLKRKGHEEEDALRITFNSYVLEDYMMQKMYLTY